VTEDSVVAIETFRRYPPSWLNRLTARVDRLPLPPLATYVLTGVVANPLIR
jgi:hypothetical protein